MNAELLSTAGAGLLSLAFAYVPGLKTWFGSKDSTTKRLAMAGALLVVAAASFGLACWQPDKFTDFVSCSEAGITELLWLYILALVANQGTYSLAVKRSVRETEPQSD